MTTVKVMQGILKGGKSQTENGFEYYEFLGVPYAKPPIGKLRFKSPQPPESWLNERDATRTNNNNVACQVDVLSGGTVTVGSEDCLYLNVYTPQLPTPESAPLPVIVYIHGGGFIIGNGTMKSENGPDYLIEQNTVVVTINYRLSVLGFLSLDIPEAAGNMGLKDQVKALQWIRDNIGQFGGDKNNVTIMGLSAGSASVEYLILSPTAKGLFHKAILNSGSTLNHWAINFQLLDLTRELVKILDYKGPLDDKKAMHEFLLTIPASNLILAAFQAAAKYSPKRLFFGFVPTVEKDYENNDAFLTTPPYKLLKEGNFSRVPTIRGFVNREGALTGIMKPEAKKYISETSDFIDYYPYDIESNKKDQYNSKFTSAYLKDTKSNDTIEDFIGDLDFKSGVWIAARFSSMNVPVYMYEFEHAGKINHFKKMFGLSSEPGALHGDDFTYHFKKEAFEAIDETDVLIRQRLVTMFSNFAKSGVPVPSSSDLVPVNWPPFTAESTMYLGIGKDLQLKTDYEPKKMAIFEELYAKSFGNVWKLRYLQNIRST
ncbi:hypothetical protein ABMA28_004731 [Loxostege sticticalis]|uniref:Carboxylic ester hydrolase n=2 Tax=Loxostege sticticalis TaxID=481309 RepID=A0ABD0SUK2_LOXSC